MVAPAHLARDQLDGLEVAGRGAGEARLDDVDAELFELLRDLELLLGGEGDAGGLLAVAQGGIEDVDLFGHCGWLLRGDAQGPVAPGGREASGIGMSGSIAALHAGGPRSYARPRLRPGETGARAFSMWTATYADIFRQVSRGGGSAASTGGTGRLQGGWGRLPRWRSARLELEALWERIRERYGSYRLVLPGEPSFICQPHECDAYCCRAFNVALDERGGGAVGGRPPAGPPSRFLESEDGEPITLPLANPFVLGRREGHCVFLSDELACDEYEARPDAVPLCIRTRSCSSTPRAGRAAQPPAEAGRRAVEAVAEGRATEGPVPLLLRHDQCPGFTGPASTEEAWARAAAGDVRALGGGERARW